MERTLIKELNASMHGKEVAVAGWCQDVRDLSKIRFIVLRDRSDSVQCVALPAEMGQAAFDAVADITKESVVAITGVVQASKQAKKGYELLVKTLTLESKALPLPLDISGKIKTQIETRLDYRFLDARRPEPNAIFRVRSVILAATVEYFDKEGFIGINTPKITAAGVESGAAMFEVAYFNKKAYLAQSPQIYKQMMVAAGFERVYEIGAVYRAEKSHTTRHLTEFTGIDLEFGFIKDENDVMDVVEGMMHHIIKRVQERCADELALLGVELKTQPKFPRITMDACKQMLKEKGKILPADEDFDPESEKLMGEIVLEKFGCDFFFATRYPWKVRPFYHMRPDDKTQTRSFDLIWKGVEIATGAQREHRYDILKAQSKEKGLDIDEMEDYANIFKYGVPAHGGCGLGLDRITQRLLNLDNIREAILLPRDTERLKP